MIASGMSSAEPYLAQDDHAVSDAALDTIFRDARTLRQWQDKPVSPALLMAIYDLMRWGPTETNITRRAFISWFRKKPRRGWSRCWTKATASRPMRAPATAIVAYDPGFRGDPAQAGAARRRKR